MSTDDSADVLLATVAEGHAHMNELLRASLGEHVIDEMALLFGTLDHLYSFLSHAVRTDGVELFNHATDTVTTGPITSSYEAFYWFLRVADPRYRVELMHVRGLSPLHTPMLYAMEKRHDDHVLAVHASFKCATEEDYGVAVATLRTDGWELLQRCDAAYGRFSYWHNPDSAHPAEWLLKPRVNLRDLAVRDE